MEPRLVILPLILALALPSLTLASPPGGGPPPRDRDKTKDPRTEERGKRRLFPPPKPFLMAGHPEFARMVEAALAPDHQIQQKLQAWPRFQEMDETGRRELRQSFDRFRRRLRDEALEDATARGWTIPPEREADFIRAYWARRIRVEQAIRQRAEQELQTAMDQALRGMEKEFLPPP